MERITIYSVAQEEGIKRKAVVARAGNLLIQELKRQGASGVIESKKQTEEWGNIKMQFRVASYPSAMRPAIIGYLQISKKIQEIIDKK